MSSLCCQKFLNWWAQSPPSSFLSSFLSFPLPAGGFQWAPAVTQADSIPSPGNSLKRSTCCCCTDRACPSAPVMLWPNFYFCCVRYKREHLQSRGLGSTELSALFVCWFFPRSPDRVHSLPSQGPQKSCMSNLHACIWDCTLGFVEYWQFSVSFWLS